jgi:hypothetical protein
MFHVLKSDCFLMVDEFSKKEKNCLILIHPPPSQYKCVIDSDKT